MTNETVVLIEKLAAQLGETSETLIGWFAMRAYWEWIDVLLLAVFITFMLFSAWTIQRSFAGHSDEEMGWVVAGLICLATVFPIVWLIVEAHQAIMSIASPNAYAFEELLKLVTP